MAHNVPPPAAANGAPSPNPVTAPNSGGAYGAPSVGAYGMPPSTSYGYGAHAPPADPGAYYAQAAPQGYGPPQPYPPPAPYGYAPPPQQYGAPYAPPPQYDYGQAQAPPPQMQYASPYGGQYAAPPPQYAPQYAPPQYAQAPPPQYAPQQQQPQQPLSQEGAPGYAYGQPGGPPDMVALAAFNAADVERKGHLDVRGFKLALQYFGVNSQYSEMLKWFESADRDKSGHIISSEFVNLCKTQLVHHRVPRQ